MKVILHVGAHRCAGAAFQAYMQRNSAVLAATGTVYWGPELTRGGLLHGILPGPVEMTGRGLEKRAAGRLRLQIDMARRAGAKRIVISDAGMMGSLRGNLRLGGLYCGVGERMARFAQAFGGAVTDVAVSLRSLETYWASVLALAAARCGRLPAAPQLQRLADSPRSWRCVLTDIACAMPGARIQALPYETFGSRPAAQLRVLTGGPVPRAHMREGQNAAPRTEELRRHLPPAVAAHLSAGEGHWQPFNAAQTAALREAYADDLMWLASGADGLAALTQDPDKQAAGQNPPRFELTRGRPHDHQDRRMAGAG